MNHRHRFRELHDQARSAGGVRRAQRTARRQLAVMGSMVGMFVGLIVASSVAGHDAPVMLLPFVMLAVLIVVMTKTRWFAEQQQAVADLETPVQAVLEPPVRPVDPERAVLEAAATNAGWVTPAMVALHAPGLSIAEARQQLERMAREGDCSVESDDRGELYYRFALSGAPQTERPLSAEAWVEAMDRRSDATGRRMSGEVAERDQTVSS